MRSATSSSSPGGKTMSRSQLLNDMTLKRGAHKTMYFRSRNGNDYAQTGTYRGDWQGNMRQGFGTQIYKDGSRYEGYWYNNVKHGQGAEYKPGSPPTLVYRGEFENGKRHGQGSCYFENGDVYEGEWTYGLRHGFGKQVYTGNQNNNSNSTSSSANNNSGATDKVGVYTGSWEQGGRSGTGTLVLPNGDVYAGSWAGDMKHGTGRYAYVARRMVYDGEWVEGAVVCGEMRDMTEQEASEGIAAAVIPDVPKRRKELPLLSLADPLGVVIDSATAAHAAADEARTLGGGGGGSTSSSSSEQQQQQQQQLPHPSSYGPAFEGISGAELGLTDEDVAQLCMAFRTGEEFSVALGLLDNALSESLGGGVLPGDIRVLGEVLAALGVYVQGEGEIDVLLGAMLASQENLDKNNRSSSSGSSSRGGGQGGAGGDDCITISGAGMVSFRVFASVMANERSAPAAGH